MASPEGPLLKQDTPSAPPVKAQRAPPSSWVDLDLVPKAPPPEEANGHGARASSSPVQPTLGPVSRSEAEPQSTDPTAPVERSGLQDRAKSTPSPPSNTPTHSRLSMQSGDSHQSAQSVGSPVRQPQSRYSVDSLNSNHSQQARNSLQSPQQAAGRSASRSSNRNSIQNFPYISSPASLGRSQSHTQLGGQRSSSGRGRSNSNSPSPLLASLEDQWHMNMRASRLESNIRVAMAELRGLEERRQELMDLLELAGGGDTGGSTSPSGAGSVGFGHGEHGSGDGVGYGTEEESDGGRSRSASVTESVPEVDPGSLAHRLAVELMRRLCVVLEKIESVRDVIEGHKIEASRLMVEGERVRRGGGA